LPAIIVCPNDSDIQSYCIWAAASEGRLTLDYASRDELCSCLDHLLTAAGNTAVMSTQLKTTLAAHAAGNYRVMMNLADELLLAAAERELDKLYEKLFFEVFAPPATSKKKNASRKG